MTAAEQALADDKMRDEIARLNAETAEISHNMRYRLWVWVAAYIAALVVILKFV